MSKINTENFFYKHRLEIGKIAKERNADVDVACMMYMTDNKLDQSKLNPELNEFLQMTKLFLQGKPGMSYQDLFHGEPKLD